jgi:hypothetical protein
MAVPEDEVKRRVAHMRGEREHVDFMEKTASLASRRLARGVPPEQLHGMAESLATLLRANRALREAAGAAPDPGELAAEAALESLLNRLQPG